MRDAMAKAQRPGGRGEGATTWDPSASSPQRELPALEAAPGADRLLHPLERTRQTP